MAPPGPGSPGPPWKIILAAVAGVAVLAIVFFTIRLSKEAEKVVPDATSSTTVNTSPVDISDWATVTDEPSGFTLKHPKDWRVTGAPAGENRLLLSAGEQNFLLVTARTVDPATVEDFIGQAMADVSIISGPSPLRLSGYPAVLYIYKSPTTADNPDEGVILHYFVIRNAKMYSLIFQARPNVELNRLARIYNAVTSSFQSTSDSKPPDPVTTEPPAPPAAASTTPTT